MIIGSSIRFCSHFLLIFVIISSIAFQSTNAEPRIILDKNDGKSALWEFEDPEFYKMNNAVIKNGRVELEKDSNTWILNDTHDFESGKLENITISNQGELELLNGPEEIFIEINTDLSALFEIYQGHYGYQTFSVIQNITLSNLIFLAKIGDNDVSNDLVVSLENENGLVLKSISVSPDNFQRSIDEILIQFHYRIKANTTYRLSFKSDESNGRYILFGTSNSVYSDGGFYKNQEINDSGDLDIEILTNQYASLGVFESELFSAQNEVVWTKIIWDGEMNENSGSVNGQFRIGNTTNADDGTWGNWSEIKDISANFELILTLSKSSHIQYRIIIDTINSYESPLINHMGISFERYFSMGYIETFDHKTPKLSKWYDFKADNESEERGMEFLYSIDSGRTWSSVDNIEDHNNSTVRSNKIRFRVNLNTDSANSTPVLRNLTISFSYQQLGDASLANEIIALGLMGTFAGSLCIGSFAYATETGRYSILKRLLFLVTPLYHRIEKENVLDHYLRRQIFLYIQSNPGSSYSEIMKDIDLKNGVLVYHLKTLEREALIKSERDGMYRRFYPIDMKLKLKEFDDLSWFQIGIYNLIRKNPGITPFEITKKLGKSKQVINYHLNIMKNSGLIRTENQGKFVTLFLIGSDLTDDYKVS